MIRCEVCGRAVRVRSRRARGKRHLHSIKDHVLCQRHWEALTEQLKSKPPKGYEEAMPVEGRLSLSFTTTEEQR